MDLAIAVTLCACCDWLHNLEQQEAFTEPSLLNDYESGYTPACLNILHQTVTNVSIGIAPAR